MPNEVFSGISFYIVAHADDWQLFMQPNAYNDLVALNKKVVFIITTAGDAGFSETFWTAREEGLKSSVRFCLAPLAALTESSGSRAFHSHAINYWSANNVTCYFLRLPDGNLDGGGFSANHHQSLFRFKDGQISTITAVDSSTTYDSWPNFSTTLQSIILFERKGIPDISLNYLNPDRNVNANDHIDHITTGQAVRNMTITSALRQVLYVGYSVSPDQQNLNQRDLFWKAGMLAAYEKAVYDRSGYSTLHESVPTYLRWCLRNANFITLIP